MAVQTVGQPARFAGAPVQYGYVASAPERRVDAHIRTLGILWVVAALLRLLEVGWIWFAGRMIVPSVLGSVLPGFTQGSPLDRVVMGGIAFASALFVLQAALAFITAWGLLERQNWGRIVGIIAGILSLLRFPLGTALGIYTLWVLLPASSEIEYRNMARA
ncbi:MAG TPA: hypothetical protein VGR81_01135 [Candidatus Acidoferrales bacterium]|nr:hypothetical protein [Candidatus Acidoferrales bacterium]